MRGLVHPMDFTYRQAAREAMPRSGLNFVGGPKIDEEGGLIFGMGGERREQQAIGKGVVREFAYWPSIASFFNRNLGGGEDGRGQCLTNQSKLVKGIYYPALPLKSSEMPSRGGGESDIFSEIVSALNSNPPPSSSLLEARERDLSLSAPITTLQSSVITRLLQQNENVQETEASKYPKTTNPSLSDSRSPVQWTYVLAISHSLVLIVLTGLVATLFAQQSSTVGSTLATVLKRKSVSLVSEGWVVTAGDCDFWYNGECLPKAGGGIPDEHTLGGVIEEREIKATGLLSSVNVPFLCLASSVISTAFSICLVSNQDERAHKSYKIFSMLVIVVFGTLFLFIQGAWSLPVNNVLLVEFSFMVTLFILMTYSANKGSYVDQARLLDMMLTNPLVAVSVLSASGDDNTSRLVLVYFSMVFGHLALLVNYSESIQCDAVTPGLSGVCRRVYWLCMVPWIVQYSFRFHYLVTKATISQPTWSIAALSFTFAAFMIRAIVITFHSWFVSMEVEGVAMDSVSVKNDDDWIFRIHFTGMVPWAIFELVIKVAIYLLIIVGFFIELNSN